MTNTPKFKEPVAPTVTIEQINNEIVSTEIVKHITEGGGILRWAILTLKNGWALTGDPSAAVCVENDDPEKGEFYATENAKRKLWQLLGYELKTKVKLIEEATPPTYSDLETYIGTKVVHAKPMDRRTYCTLRNWDLPEDENGDDEGYLVEYGDSPGTDGWNGYISWTPKNVFERSYKTL